MWLSPKFSGQIKNVLFLFIIHSSRGAQGKIIDAGGQDVCVCVSYECADQCEGV